MIGHYKTVFGEEVNLSEEKWKHIVDGHPEVKRFAGKIKKVLTMPDLVKLSKRDPGVHLYYKFFNEIYGGKHLLVVVNGHAKTISTVFITDKIKVGETIWPGK